MTHISHPLLSRGQVPSAGGSLVIGRRSLLGLLATSGFGWGGCSYLPEPSAWGEGTQEASAGTSVVCTETPGEIHESNHQTRLVLVADHILSSKGKLQAHLQRLIDEDHTLSETDERNVIRSRLVLKAMIQENLTPGELLPASNGQPFTVEACVPVVGFDTPLFWVVIGQNRNPRATREVGWNADNALLASLVTKTKQPETVDELRKKVVSRPLADKEGEAVAGPKNTSVRFRVLSFEDIAGADSALSRSIQALYADAFTHYPYAILDSLRSSLSGTCGAALIVAGVVDEPGCASPTVVCMAGLHTFSIESFGLVGEISDVASRRNIGGLGPLLLRFLLQNLTTFGSSAPRFVFTESRLGAMIPVGLRAGLVGSPTALLPHHTEIASNGPAGDRVLIPALDGTLFPLENMTITYASAGQVAKVLDDYGRVPDEPFVVLGLSRDNEEKNPASNQSLLLGDKNADNGIRRQITDDTHVCVASLCRQRWVK